MKKIFVLFNLSIVLLLNANGQHLISGTVYDETKYPIPGVNIVIDGTTVGTVTSIDGLYTIECKAGDVLRFSLIGYTTQKVKVTDQKEINISFYPDLKKLDEVVVIGYGVQKKSDLTGAISSVKSEDLENMAVGKIDQALQGKVAGVQITQNTGAPGKAVSVKIRGTGTVGNTDPLYVVDGFPVSGIDMLNPSDIESIEILKDASACAIYGARGANGVVLISTKKGKSGSFKVNFDAYQGIQSRWNKVEMCNAEEYAMLQNQARTDGNTKLNPRFGQPDTLGAGTDWTDAIFRDAAISDYQLNISGGNEKNLFSVSSGLFKQEGIIKATDFERISFRVNASQQVNEKLKIGENISLSSAINHGIDENEHWNSVLLMAMCDDPSTPIYNDETVWQSSLGNAGKNAVGVLERLDREFKTLQLLGNVFAEYKIFKELTFRSTFGMDVSNSTSYNYTPVYFVSPSEQNEISSLHRGFYAWQHWAWENTLTYSKIFAEKHNLTVLAGISAEESYSENITTSASHVPGLKEMRYLDAGQEPYTSGGIAVESSLSSYLGRAIYSYNNKYLITASIRRDGSSKFGPKKKYGVFPSTSLGWKVSEESFLKSIKAISNLKIRAGWGQIGNQSIGNYRYVTSIFQGRNYSFGKTPALYVGYAPYSSANEEIHWETTEQTNLGIDLGLWENKLTLSVDLFDKKTKDMLVDLPAPGIAGLSWPATQNAGNVSNKGIELFGSFSEKRGDFSYQISGNLSSVRNKVVSLGDGAQPIASGSFAQSGNLSLTQEGYPIASFFGFKTDGIFQNWEEVNAHAQPKAKPGDIRFVDVNKDGTINSKDQTFIGSPLPNIIYGFNANCSYKNIDFSIDFQGQEGNQIFNNTLYWVHGTGAYNFRKDMLNHWTPTNTDSNIPRIDVKGKNDNLRISDYYLEDGSYLRIKNVTLGYSLNETVCSALHISKLRLYVSAQNLFTFTDYSGWDPEIGQQKDGGWNSLAIGIDYGVYPQARTFLGGISLSF